VLSNCEETLDDLSDDDDEEDDQGKGRHGLNNCSLGTRRSAGQGGEPKVISSHHKTFNRYLGRPRQTVGRAFGRGRGGSFALDG
jgi:hypothetical protein